MGALADSVATAVAEGLLPRRAPLLVACSGGADSVALAAAAAQNADLQVALGHVDHGLRPESKGEAEQVRELARRLGVPFYLERLANLDIHGRGLEAAAREGRYPALARLALQAGARTVATAHTRRDQAETLLLRLVRGAGPGALAAVRRRRALGAGIDLVRPLLQVSRSDTEAFCRDQGLPFTSDPHNDDPRRTRARLRKLWPLLLELNPRLEEALAGTAESLAEEDAFLMSLLPCELGLPALRALAAPLLRRALLRAAAEAGLRPERHHLAGLQKLVGRERGCLDLPGGRAEIRRGALRFLPTEGRPRKPEASPAELAIPGPGRYAFGPRELAVSAGPGDGLNVDLTRAPFPWTLRGHRPGDRFRPAGGRTRKISDLWIDAAIPREERAGLALIADAQGRIFWVEKVREGDACRGAMSHIASVRFGPEMKLSAGPLALKRRPESRSATMDPRPDEEPR